MKPLLLAITSEPPWPLDTGGHLRTFHLLRALARDYRVRLIVPVTAAQTAHAAALTRSGLEVRPVPVGARTPLSEGRRLLTAAMTRRPYVLYGRHDRAEVRAAVRAAVAEERPHVVYLDHLDSFQYAAEAGDIPTVVDLHNVYSLLIRREADDQSRAWLRRRFLAREAGLLEQAEIAAVTGVHAVLSVSEQERRHFGRINGTPVHLVPNGVDCAAYDALPDGRAGSPPDILFIGTMSWGPNAAAARALAEALPQIRRAQPAATLTIVGRDPSAAVRALAAQPGVTVAGGVSDVMPYLRHARVLAVPLEAGGGTRLKVLEAFAAGLPVVSTPVGCEGLPVAHARELLIAARPAFVDAVITTLGDTAAALARARVARALVRARYDWPVVADAARAAVAAATARRVTSGTTTPSPPRQRRPR